MSTLETNLIQPSSGTLTLGASGDTITVRGHIITLELQDFQVCGIYIYQSTANQVVWK